MINYPSNFSNSGLSHPADSLRYCPPDWKWHSPPAALAFDPGVVHLWRAVLTLPEEQRSQLEKLLSVDEVQRCQRLRSQQAQERFIASRGILRLLLGRYLQRSPTELEFNYSPTGKPALAAEQLHFNLSHSHNLVLYAVCRDYPVGIDLEHVRNCNYPAIGRRFLTPAEQSLLFSLPLDQQLPTFFQIWTCKEAIIKALGGSVFSNLEQLEVLSWLQPGGSTALSPTAHPEGQLYLFDPGENYRAALGVIFAKKTLPPPTLKLWNWEFTSD